MTNRANALLARLAAGETLPLTETVELGESTDILALGMAADDARRLKHGAETTFLRVCTLDLPPAASEVALPPAAREVRVQGPLTDLTAALEALRRVVHAAGSTPVSAWSLADLESAARASGKPLVDVLREIRHAGVALVAEAPLDRLDQPEAALEAVRDAGLELARLTIDEGGDRAARIGWLLRAAELQHTLGWIRSFAPLPRRWDAAAPSTGYDDVRHVALARLVADNIPSIQVDWALYGPKLAQVALTVGADDVDGVSASDEAPDGRRRSPLEEIRRNIQAAALVPVERDAVWRRIGG